eukprot:m.114571 g.114571  ORF g.114571 m.114571 type:complete len:53 (+) comp13057_c0_seq2:1327-1485(+)
MTSKVFGRDRRKDFPDSDLAVSATSFGADAPTSLSRVCGATVSQGATPRSMP